MAEPLNHPASAPIAEPIDERILAEAAAWLAQLQDGPLPPAEQARLAAWRQQSPQHQRAWQRAERLLGQLNALPAPLAGPALHASAQASRRASLTRIAKGTALVLLIAPASWLLWQRQPWQHWRHWMDADYAALPGQNLDLQLDDGSQLSLHAGSQLDVRYSRSQRLLHLRQGELYVHTAADNAQPPRPFIVSTAHGRMQALGTRFAVRQLDGQLDGQPDRQPDAAPGGDGGSTLLAVYEGAVRIEPADAPSAAHRTLRAGQQARFTREAIAPSTTAREADTAWRQGLLIADAMPLPDWAAALARHSGRSIRVLPAAQALRISGTFPLSDPDRALRMLATTLRLRIRQRGQGEGAVVEIG
ncbi:FecR domain-containing protein [Vandammella animalimorsus]|uniref:Iron dicitrate transport regulator FecR n=1 Tax=Vandammella animalimorsus TaxID=2029117 RepID=A0A2A2ASQ6_9BURK|nr:FecR family protein [Vandammella animalimorsus]PAT40787.1 iron dicitrate transport regulator FecR [Vandammella animalimorsus]RRD68639.1 FecR family protein [Comamonadaceae bacterium OH2310_COT-174]